MSSVKHLMVLKIKEVVVKACQTDIDPNDETYVDVVEIRSTIGPGSGSERLAITIRHFDPSKPDANGDSTIGDRISSNTVGIQLPPGLIGGTLFEQIRGSIEVNANLSMSGEDAVKADEIIQEVLSRAKNALRHYEFRVIKDSYGEQVFAFRVTGGNEYDSGADISNTTRYFLRWTAFTQASVRPDPLPVQGLGGTI